MRHVLVLEDEEQIREFIVINLKRAGYQVLEAGTGEQALEILAGAESDATVAVLDVMLPGIDGFEVCRAIREKDQAMGIIMLTARGQEEDKVNGLSIGADDYVVKPFSPAELVARVDALCRRIELMNKQDTAQITAPPFVIDTVGRRVLKNGNEIELTKTEYEIVKLLVINKNRSLSRDYILDTVWGKDYVGSYKIVDVNVRRIRQKLEEDASYPQYVKTVWGYGYRWKEEDRS